MRAHSPGFVTQREEANTAGVFVFLCGFSPAFLLQCSLPLRSSSSTAYSSNSNSVGRPFFPSWSFLMNFVTRGIIALPLFGYMRRCEDKTQFNGNRAIGMPGTSGGVSPIYMYTATGSHLSSHLYPCEIRIMRSIVYARYMKCHTKYVCFQQVQPAGHENHQRTWNIKTPRTYPDMDGRHKKVWYVMYDGKTTVLIDVRHIFSIIAGDGMHLDYHIWHVFMYQKIKKRLTSFISYVGTTQI